MKKAVFASALLIGSFFLFSFSNLHDWISYTSKEGNYKMMFPSKPAEQQQTIPSAVGEITMYMAMVESEDENASNLLYMTAFCAYPADKVSSEAPTEVVEKFFKGATEGSAKKINGNIRTMTSSSYKGFPVRDVLIDAKMAEIDFVVTQRLILVKNNFYMIQIFTPKEMEANTEAKKFVESFSLVD